MGHDDVCGSDSFTSARGVWGASGRLIVRLFEFDADGTSRQRREKSSM